MSYNFYNIKNTETIGDSLTSANLNYINLQNWLSEMQNQYDNNWKPIVDFYNTHITDYKNTLSLVNQFSSNWEDFATTIENNSAKWLQPITIFYPYILDAPYSESYTKTINSWLNLNYPVLNNYIENQKFIINVYTETAGSDSYTQINNRETLTDYTVCYTDSFKLCANCKTVAFGPIITCNGGYSCPAEWNCQKCINVNCLYVKPPYIPLEESFLATTGLYYIPADDGTTNNNTLKQIHVSDVETLSSHFAKGQIQADISMTYQDKWESDIITSLVFKVKNCEWQFDKYITS